MGGRCNKTTDKKLRGPQRRACVGTEQGPIERQQIIVFRWGTPTSPILLLFSPTRPLPSLPQSTSSAGRVPPPRRRQHRPRRSTQRRRPFADVSPPISTRIRRLFSPRPILSPPRRGFKTQWLPPLVVPSVAQTASPLDPSSSSSESSGYVVCCCWTRSRRVLIPC